MVILRCTRKLLVKLGVQPANVEEVRSTTRLIVGEVRGGEAFDLLQALNTGHSGTLSTIHANSAEQALARFSSCVVQSGVELPYQAVRYQIADAIHLVLHLGRSQGARVVPQLLRITRYEVQRDRYETDVLFECPRAAQGGDRPVSPRDFRVAMQPPPSRDAKSIAIRVRIDLDHDSLDRDAGRLPAANRLHADETGGLKFRQRPRQVRLRSPGQISQFGHRPRLPITDQRKQTPVIGREQTNNGLDRVEARLAGISGSRSLAARHRFHLRPQRSETLNLCAFHFDLPDSSSLVTRRLTPRSRSTRSTSSKKSSSRR